MAIVDITDLPAAVQAAELVDAMLGGANAKALRVAPCLGYTGAADSDTPAPTTDQLAEAKLVLIGAISRWAEAGAGSLSQQSAGPFSMTVDTRQRTGFNFWPSEIEQLQNLCADLGGGVYVTSLAGPDPSDSTVMSDCWGWGWPC